MSLIIFAERRRKFKRRGATDKESAGAVDQSPHLSIVGLLRLV